MYWCFFSPLEVCDTIVLRERLQQLPATPVRKIKNMYVFFKKKQKQRSDGPERSVQNSWLEMKVGKLYGGLSDERAAGQT